MSREAPTSAFDSNIGSHRRAVVTFLFVSFDIRQINVKSLANINAKTDQLACSNVTYENMVQESQGLE